LDSLRADAGALDAGELARLASGLAEAVAGVQAAAVAGQQAARAAARGSQAGTDSLTGLGDLTHLHERLGHALALHTRYGHRFSLLVLDVNGLARVNDSRGRAAGDRVLVQVALAVRRTIRTVDTAARIGGDEVCVLAPDQTATDMSALATRLVDSVTAESEQPGQAGVDVAIGVAACPEHGDDVEYLLAAAEQAMYRAKAEGEPYVLAGPAAEIKVQRTR